MKEKEIGSLQHTTWRCQYHVVFAPKYRRMAIYGQIRKDIGQILRKLCEQKGVEIIEAQACPDHIHMLISIPPKYSVSQIMGYLKKEIHKNLGNRMKPGVPAHGASRFTTQLPLLQDRTGLDMPIQPGAKTAVQDFPYGGFLL